MIANPAITHPAAVPRPFTLNDLRGQRSIAQQPSSTAAFTRYGLVLAVVVAIGAFIWLDPLRLFTPIQASPPAPALVPSAEPARPTERQEIIAPVTPVPVTKSVDRIAQAPVVQAPHVAAPAARPRAASIKPESRGNPMDKSNATVLQAKPEEKTDAPIVLKLDDDSKNAPKPAATNDQTPVTE